MPKVRLTNEWNYLNKQKKFLDRTMMEIFQAGNSKLNNEDFAQYIAV